MATSRKVLIAIVAVAFCVALNLQSAQGQTDNKKFEAGGQFSLSNVTTFGGSVTIFPCINPPCPATTTFTRDRVIEPGFGGRIGYNISRHVTLEAEGNFFPRDRNFEGGRKMQGLFGAKVGKRFEKVGIFAKARPGFIHYSKGDLRQGQNVCIQIFPPAIGCFVPTGRTWFAFDLGVVVELYPSKRTIIRLDAGDTIIHSGERNVAVALSPPPASPSVVVRAPAVTTHNFQANIGFGWRF